MNAIIKTAWNKGKKGVSKETSDKMRLAKLGKKQSYDTKVKRGIYIKGRIVSEETKEKLRLSHLGVPLTKEHRDNLRGQRPNTQQEKNWRWKGENIGYRTLHHWVKRYKGQTKSCEHCGKEKTTPKSIHWANKSHEYKRELTDWISLCAKCHAIYDDNRGRHKKTVEI